MSFRIPPRMQAMVCMGKGKAAQRIEVGISEESSQNAMAMAASTIANGINGVSCGLKTTGALGVRCHSQIDITRRTSMKFVLKCMLVVACGFLLIAVCHHIAANKYSQPLGTASHDHAYRLVTLEDEKGLIYSAMVVTADIDYSIVYSVPRYFTSRKGFHACWAEGRNDFFRMLPRYWRLPVRVQ